MNLVPWSDSVCHRLEKGRIPFAGSDLRGDLQNPSVVGWVRFYDTPAGVLILAEVKGLPRGEEKNRRLAGYEFYIKDGGDTYPCSYLPALYEKEGGAWCSVVTAKLNRFDLFDRELLLCEKTAGKAMGVSVAVGHIVAAETLSRKRSYAGSSIDAS